MTIVKDKKLINLIYQNKFDIFKSIFKTSKTEHANNNANYP